MPTSQNGYPANDRSAIVTIRVGRNNVPIPVRKGIVAQVFTAFCNAYDKHVEELKAGQCWGYAFRTIRGSSTTLSNHASGTAVDLMSLIHMRGVKGTFTKEQKAMVRRLLSWLTDPHDGKSVLRWGEDYVNSPVDGMHYEVWEANEGALARAFENFLTELDKFENPETSEKPKPEPADPGVGTMEPPKFPLKRKQYFGPKLPLSNENSVSGFYDKLPNGKPGHKGLLTFQRRLRDRGWGIDTDGLYGDQTERITRLFQQEKRLKVDGLIGQETWDAAWTANIT